MLIREIGPFRIVDGWWEGPAAFNLCADKLAGWFDIDEDKPLWVQIHNRAAKNRLEIIGAGKSHLRVIDQHGNPVWIFVCGAWVYDLKIPYPHYAEIVQ